MVLFAMLLLPMSSVDHALNITELLVLLNIIKIMLKKESMATTLFRNKTRDFRKEVGKVTKTNTLLTNLVVNVTGDENIYKLFAIKYDKL